MAGQGNGSPSYPKNGYPPRQAGYIKQEPGTGTRYPPARGFQGRPRAAAYQGEEVEDEGDQQANEDEHEYPEQEAEEGFYGNEDLSYYYLREDQQDDQEAQAHFASPNVVAQSIKCLRCQARFPSKNQLHKYLRSHEYCLPKPSVSKPSARPSPSQSTHSSSS